MAESGGRPGGPRDSADDETAEVELRFLLAEAGQRERRPPRDAVPGVMMRLRLRRNAVSSANELFEGIAALVRGLAGLFSLPADPRPHRLEDDRRE